MRVSLIERLVLSYQPLGDSYKKGHLCGREALLMMKCEVAHLGKMENIPFYSLQGMIGSSGNLGRLHSLDEMLHNLSFVGEGRTNIF